MEKPLIHILIVWSNAYSHLDYIVNDISSNFKLLNRFQFIWSETYFHTNLIRFYSHSQSHRTEAEFNDIIEKKIKHCGSGEFTVLIFEDETPNFQNRKTSNGINLVNANVFDKKADYRSLTGGGHKIHSSDNYFEGNKDIALLLNTTLDDYKKDYISSDKGIKKENNILGVPYWNSIENLLFALSNSMNYVVLRNFECLPNDYYVEGHGDIDLLVENYNYVKYLTGAVSVFPEIDYRVHHHININKEEVPFDFRYLGDNYYDSKWELDILNNRSYKEGFHTPNEENYFYSLLYHAYIHKKKVSKDYKERLEKLAKSLKIDYEKEILDKEAIKLLKLFMNNNGYKFSLPDDFSVSFNKRNTISDLDEEVNEYYGKLISSSTSRTSSHSYLTEVYEKENTIVKIASNPISENEYAYLTKLKGANYFPNVLRIENKRNFDLVEIERIKGFHINEINYLSTFWKTKNIFNFLLDGINILIHLLENNISHRDIRPDNFIIVKTKNVFSLRLIDFGWAEDINERESINPIGLGTNYKYGGDSFSDAYSMGLTLKHCLGNLNVSNDLVNLFMEITSEDYTNALELTNRLNSIKESIEQQEKKTTLKQNCQVFYRRLKTRIGIKTIKKIKTSFNRPKKIFQKIKKRLLF